MHSHTSTLTWTHIPKGIDTAGDTDILGQMHTHAQWYWEILGDIETVAFMYTSTKEWGTPRNTDTVTNIYSYTCIHAHMHKTTYTRVFWGILGDTETLACICTCNKWLGHIRCDFSLLSNFVKPLFRGWFLQELLCKNQPHKCKHP